MIQLTKFYRPIERLLKMHRFSIAYGLFMFVLGVMTSHIILIKTPREIQNTVTLDTQTKPAGQPTQAVVSIKKPAASSQAPLSTIETIQKSLFEAGEEHSIDVVVSRGDTFGGILAESGLDRKDAHTISQSLKGVFDVKKLDVGQKLSLHFRELDNSGLVELRQLVIDAPEEKITLTREGAEGYKAEKIVKKLEKQMTRAGGIITSSLYSLASDLDIPPGVLAEAISAYSYDVDFQRDIQAGNRFEVMYETYNDDQGRKIRDGDLQYAVLSTGGEELKIYRFATKDGDEDFYNDKGMSVRKALLRTPVNGARITSGFGMRRHPLMGYTKMHKGVDFGAPTGTPIYAAGDGVIEQMGKKGGYGNYIRVRHQSGYATAYAHISKFAKEMRHGRRVKQGQVIAYVGSTGISTGPHLHYEVHINGKQVNPSKVKTTPGRSLGKTEIARFNQTKKEAAQLLASLPLKTQFAAKD